MFNWPISNVGHRICPFLIGARCNSYSASDRCNKSIAETERDSRSRVYFRCVAPRHESGSRWTSGDERRAGFIVSGLTPSDPEGREMKAPASRDVVGTDRMKRTDRMRTAGEVPAAAMAASHSLALLAVIAWCSCWLMLIGECAGQKPINLGNKKRDVYIAGFFPYGNHVPEGHIGRGVMPAVKLAVEHINEHPTILRDYRLHMWWNDTEVSFLLRREWTIRGMFEKSNP